MIITLGRWSDNCVTRSLRSQILFCLSGVEGTEQRMLYDSLSPPCGLILLSKLVFVLGLLKCIPLLIVVTEVSSERSSYLLFPQRQLGYKFSTVEGEKLSLSRLSNRKYTIDW